MLTAALIDHHDSFTFNIKAWLTPSFDIFVFDVTDIDKVNPHDFDLIVMSPGPKSPHDYPASLNFLQALPPDKPVLGICLGLQMMNLTEGGTVQPYSPPVHGKSSRLESDQPLLKNLMVARYHSLECKIASTFETLATSDGITMIARHHKKKWLGYQFHPESFLTEHSQNFVTFLIQSYFSKGAPR